MVASRVRFAAAAFCLLAMSAAGQDDIAEAFGVTTPAPVDGELPATNRPVTRVITLLKDMLKQLQKEAEEDQDIYDKLACWCETNDREKTKAIKEAEEKIDMLLSKIEELTGMSAQFGTEIKNLGKDIAKDEDSLDKAIAIRKKELAEFVAEEKDLLQAITSLKAAIAVLSKHHTSFLQMPEHHLVRVASTLQHVMTKHANLFKGVLTHSQRRVVASFMQTSYAPQSGEIFGILQQMLETFETNLAGAQKDEQAAVKAFEELKASKEEEIAAATELKNRKAKDLAGADEKLANMKIDLDDTRAKLGADQQFLMMLKEKCEMTDKEWEERTKTRQLEMEAVSKALAILNSDDAHDTFTRTFTFVQKEAAGHRLMRSQAAELLTTVAKNVHSPRLAAIASRVRLDAFTRVKKAIDDMVAQLLKEKQDEIKHKDFCVDELNKNLVATERKDREKSDLMAKIEDLKLTIETLTKEIAALKEEIAEMQLQLKRAGEDREKENNEFKLVVADQRATQKLLQAALAVLQGFYEKKAALLQSQQEPAGPPPPPGFKEYKKNKSSGGVMGMIAQIIKDAKAMEAEAIRDEENAGKAYEDFVMDTNASIEAAKKSIVEKSEEKAQAEIDLTEAEEALAAAELELEQLANYGLQVHQACDYILKNFEARQTARDEEIEALKQAKAILSGAKFEAFLQFSR